METPLPPPPTKFYGVWIPPSSSSTDTSCVTSDLKTVTSLLARNPGSRFLVASSEAEAQTLIQDETAKKDDDEDAESGPPPNAPLTPQGNSKKPQRRKRLSLPASNSKLGSVEPPLPPPPPVKPFKPSDAEKVVNKFPSPRTQDLTAMARDISRGVSIVPKVTANPRLLSTDCDLPTTVQEGCHYNALHVAAKANNSEAIAFILNTVGSLNYFRLLGNSDEDIAMLRARLVHLSDGYLNTPDKMANETPLHFASKFLAVEAVEVLVSHPLTDKNVRNIYKESPADIIGLRGNPEAPDFVEKKKAIESLLGERVIVPLWKDSISGAASSSVVGEMATIRQLGEALPPPLLKHFRDFDVAALGRCSSFVYPKKHNSLRMFSCDSSWTICAFGGPMTVKEASQLTAALKLTSGLKFRPNSSSADLNAPFTPPNTPPFSPMRSPTVGPSTPEILMTSPLSPTLSHTSLRLSDPEKGLERIASKFCSVLGVSWAEWWWPFGRDFFFGDLASPEGLSALNAALECSVNSVRKVEREEEIQTSVDDVLDKLANNFMGLKLNTSIGYPTPRKVSECRNPECQVDERFCTCEGVAPPLPSSVFVPRKLVLLSSSTESSSCPSLTSRDFRAEGGDLESAKRRDVFDTSVDSLATNRSICESEGSFEYEDSFESAVNSEDEEEDEFFECRSKPFFFNGLFPTKQDFQLYAALKENEAEICVQSVPLVFQWINIMKSLGGKSVKVNVKSEESVGQSPLEESETADIFPLSQKGNRRTSSTSSSSRSSRPRRLAW